MMYKNNNVRCTNIRLTTQLTIFLKLNLFEFAVMCCPHQIVSEPHLCQAKENERYTHTYKHKHTYTNARLKHKTVQVCVCAYRVPESKAALYVLVSVYVELILRLIALSEPFRHNHPNGAVLKQRKLFHLM